MTPIYNRSKHRSRNSTLATVMRVLVVAIALLIAYASVSRLRCDPAGTALAPAAAPKTRRSRRAKTSSGSGSTRPTPPTRTAARTTSSRTRASAPSSTIPHRAADLLGHADRRPLPLARQHRARLPHRPRTRSSPTTTATSPSPAASSTSAPRAACSGSTSTAAAPPRRLRRHRLDQEGRPTTDPAAEYTLWLFPNEPLTLDRHRRRIRRRADPRHRPLGRPAARRLRHRPEHHPRHPRRSRRHAARSPARRPSASHRLQTVRHRHRTAPALKPRNYATVRNSRTHYDHIEHHTPHPLRKSLAAAPRRRARRRALDPLHRPPPRPRGHLARRPSKACASPAASCAAPTAPSPRSTTTSPPPPSHDRLDIVDQIAAAQVDALRKNCAEFGVEFFDVQDRRPGHRPHDRPRARRHQARHDHRLRRLAHLHPRSLRRTRLRHRHQRGRARHGHADPAAGQAQDLPHHRRRRPPLRRHRQGHHPRTSSAEIGTAGATGYVVEYAGSAIRALSMEGRMTICNMSIEAGARAGMIAPDETTFAYLKGRRFSPQGAAWDEAVAALAHSAHRRRRNLRPRTHTSTPPRSRPPSPGAPRPAWSPPSTRTVPTLDRRRHRSRPQELRARLRVHGPQARHAHRRDQDRHRLPRLLHQRPHRRPPRRRRQSSSGHHVATTVRAMVVPGSQAVKAPGRSRRPRRRSSRPPASSGASPAAPCASA